MPVTAPQVQLAPRHLSSTTLTAQLLNSATQMTVASGAIFDTLPTAALLTDGVNVEIVSVDSLASGTTYNLTRAIEPGTAAATFPANTTQVKLIIAAETMRRLQRAFRERTTGLVNVLEYGATGDGVAGAGSITAGSNVLTSPSVLVGDVGAALTILGAGVGGAPLVTTIAARTDSTHITLGVAASTSVTAAFCTWNNHTSRLTVTAGQTAATVVGLWSTADVGKKVVMQGAGASALFPLVATITGFTSGFQVTLGATAGTTSGGAFVYGTDDTAAFQAALASLPTGRGGRITVPPAIYVISGTLQLGSHTEFWGMSAGQGPRLIGDLNWESGSCLVWAGAINLPMVKVFDAYATIVHGITVSAENVPGVIGFQLDSTGGGVGASQLNTFEHINMWHCAIAFLWGQQTAGTVALGEQADTTVIRRFHIAAPTIADTAQGIVINTVNSQLSRIEQGIIQSVNKGIHYQHTGMINTLDRVAFGAITTGSNPTAIQISPVGGELLMINCQAEGVTFFLRALDRVFDADPGGVISLAAITLQTCHLDTPILVTGQQTIVTIGCTASVGTGATSYTSNGVVVSLGDDLNNTWTLTGSGTLTEWGSTLGGSAVFRWRAPQFELANALGSPAVWKKHLTIEQSITGTLVAAGGTSEYSISLPGARQGDTCVAVPDAASSLAAGLIWNAFCKANDIVTLRVSNITGGGITPATVLWRATVLGY